MALKLRGRGPHTFVSYAFGNTVAPQIAETLRQEGFPVTLVDDTMLIGEPSLTAALERFVGEAELVVPVLDSAANRSNWVAHELAIAKQLRRVIIPVVEDEASLPEPVRDIPYLTESNLGALVPSALSRYGLLPLDPDNPCHLTAEPLGAYLNSKTRFARTILDSDNLTGLLWESAQRTLEEATREQPQIRAGMENRIRLSLEKCERQLNRAELLLPRFREGVEHALESYGPERAKRSVAPWQRMIRLTFARELLRVAKTLPADGYAGFWGEGAAAIETASRAVQRAERSKREEPSTIRALEYFGEDGRDGWTKAVFYADGYEFLGVVPKSQSTVEGLRGRSKPLDFFEAYQWADFGLPQAAANAVSDSSGDTMADSIAWNLEDYHSSALPG